MCSLARVWARRTGRFSGKYVCCETSKRCDVLARMCLIDYLEQFWFDILRRIVIRNDRGHAADFKLFAPCSKADNMVRSNHKNRPMSSIGSLLPEYETEPDYKTAPMVRSHQFLSRSPILVKMDCYGRDKSRGCCGAILRRII